ncbi:FAD-dependent oxidoreductase [Amycolatopsis magusensis]|uniref:FAD-dependent oxidoreductase n=1 Tax=Amycolatopsis magusensis TaxID=882444 RepID=UPI0024A99F95|nr:FAD-dependent oxidoreductase [Amycolatopsis magusensis]MDI5976143.1 FAD-dependent oxidoreductase [Amycolatopsis magusensis]
MAYAITQNCCNDASCVSVCPVNCIHPTPDEPGFATAEMLYIDPRACIDCGACADACPVDAITPVDLLSGPDTVYTELTRQYFAENPADNEWGAPRFPPPVPAELRVAVVGTGPAACYTADSLLRLGAEVSMIERQPVPGGLLRFGVAPDHPSTKQLGDTFAGLFQHPRLRLHLNVEVGADISHADLAAHHHAVVYATGAAVDKPLGVPGEDLTGVLSATAFVAWYSAHPEAPAGDVDLSAERAVIIGNGNVALDVARILLADPDDLARTDIADHALEALRDSRIREVVLLGRRGPEHAAFTRPEFLALRHLPGVRVVVDGAAVRDADPGSKAAVFAEVDAEEIDWDASPPPGKRIVFRFMAAPIGFEGEGSVEAVALTGGESLPAKLVLRATGYRGRPLAGLPFDEKSATVPHVGGRVAELPGTYVVGWIKRGSSGGIGTNRVCAAETVDALLEDAAAGRLLRPGGSRARFGKLVRRRKPESLGGRAALAIDRAERALGSLAGRPRVKFATVQDLVAAGKSRFRS